MKRTKILIPALSAIATIGMVMPFITSCAKDKVILIDQFFDNPDGDADTIVSKTLSLKEHKIYSFKVEFKNAAEGQFTSSAVLIGPQRSYLASFGGIIAVFDMKFNGQPLTRIYDEDQFVEGTYGLWTSAGSPYRIGAFGYTMSNDACFEFKAVFENSDNFDVTNFVLACQHDPLS